MDNKVEIPYRMKPKCKKCKEIIDFKESQLWWQSKSYCKPTCWMGDIEERLKRLEEKLGIEK